MAILLLSLLLALRFNSCEAARLEFVLLLLDIQMSGSTVEKGDACAF
jgi:hypothetical protein